MFDKIDKASIKFNVNTGKDTIFKVFVEKLLKESYYLFLLLIYKRS